MRKTTFKEKFPNTLPSKCRDLVRLQHGYLQTFAKNKIFYAATKKSALLANKVQIVIFEEFHCRQLLGENSDKKS